MKLANRDVSERLSVELNKKIKQGGGVMTFGENDDYPNVIESVVAGSVTAISTSDIYSRFLTGGGFKQEGVNDIVIGNDIRGKQIKMLDLLRLISQSVSIFNGVYLHVPINKLAETGCPQIFNFKYCRFTKIDDIGYTPTIAYNKNFGTGKKFKGSDTIEYPIFNNSKDVIIEQAMKAGGFENYRGQVYFQFWDNRFLYPLSPYDPVYLDADTEWQVSLYKNRELRNGFMLRYLLRVAEFENDQDKEKFVKLITNSEGADASRVVVLEDEFDSETGDIVDSGSFKLEKIESNIDDKLFENWEKGLANKIRKANKALPALLIDYENSNLGTTSGEAINQAVNFYNGMTKDDRSLMSRVFAEIFKNSYNPEIRSISNWEIIPFSLEEEAEEVIEVSAEQKNKDAQASLRGSVGGFNAVIALQQGIQQGTTTKPAAIAALEILMGVTKSEAIRLIGDPLEEQLKE